MTFIDHICRFIYIRTHWHIVYVDKSGPNALLGLQFEDGCALFVVVQECLGGGGGGEEFGVAGGLLSCTVKLG